MHSSAVFSRADTIESPVELRRLTCSGVTLDLDRRRGLVGGVDLRLSAAEFAVLQSLFCSRGVPMSKEAISAALPVQVDLRMIDVYVSRARTKLAAAGQGDAIQTIWGRGYMASDPSDELSREPPTTCDRSAAPIPA